MIRFYETVRLLMHDNARLKAYFIKNEYHFKYYGFEWVHVYDLQTEVVLTWINLISSVCLTIGFCYRFAAFTFFLGFTRFFLLDKVIFLYSYFFSFLFSVVRRCI